jgi:hypothetical protein
MSSLDERVATLEREVASLQRRVRAGECSAESPWWERIFGSFADDPDFDEATRLGREYRESLRPTDDVPKSE